MIGCEHPRSVLLMTRKEPAGANRSATRFIASCLGAVAVAALLTTTSTAGGQAPTVYSDAIGDAGDAPDVARVTIRPVAGGLAVDIALAGPTRLGPYGWILLGVDTDRNAYTGGGRGDELLLFVNGEGATFTRWIGGEFSPDFAHHDVEAAFSGTDLTLVLSWADIGSAVVQLLGRDPAPARRSRAWLRDRDVSPDAYARTRTPRTCGPAPSLTPRSALTQTPHAAKPTQASNPPHAA